jgi:CheY-like chemotaxis protein
VEVSLRVLVVDDNRPFLDAATVLLEREGLIVAGVATTSADALQRAETLRPDVVLVDVFLGRESGFELARRLVDNGPTAAATVILISTHDEVDFGDLIAASPAASFLPKTELSASAIRRVVDNHSS